MPNKYLEKKIRLYEWLSVIVVSVLVIIAYLCGRYIVWFGYKNIILGLILGVFSGITVVLVEHFVNSRQLYLKGKYFEDEVERKINRLNYERHVQTDYGDLDFFVKTERADYGIEAKNYCGKIAYENGVLMINDFEDEGILKILLKHCAEVRNQKYGKDSNKFIKPVLVFGHKAGVDIPGGVVRFGNADIVITDIQHLTNFLV